MKGRLLLSGFVAAAFLFYGSTQSRGTSQNGPKTGDKPPLLQATTLLQAPPGAKLDTKALRGKVVVLEFWATWCGPCVAAISHLNELADKFKDKPIQFVAITAEDQATIEPFLKKRPIKAWVALDGDKAMNRAYGITGIPHTIIVGKDGNIAAITHPSALTEQMLNDVLKGKKLSLPEPSREKGLVAGEDPGEADLARPLFEVLVRPSSATNSSSVGGGGQFTARGYTVWDILPRAFEAEPARIMTNGPLPGGRFDFVVAQKTRSDEKVGALLQQGLQSAFGLTGHKETREMDVMVLQVKTTNAPGLVASPTPGGASRVGPGKIEGTNFSIPGLAKALESQSGLPVFDETSLTNRYDVSLQWDQTYGDKPNREGLKKAVKEQLGLELVPGTRQVEVTVVDIVQTVAGKEQ